MATIIGRKREQEELYRLSHSGKADRKYDAELRRKLEVFAAETNQRKALHTTLVTTYGLIPNEYSNRIQRVVTMDALFRQ